MQIVNKIACINNAGFVQKFKVKWVNGGSSGWTDYYPNPESKTLDLNNFNIPEGAEAWVEVDAFLGKTKSSNEHVKYSLSAQATATYRVTGTTLFFDIDLQGN